MSDPAVASLVASTESLRVSESPAAAAPGAAAAGSASSSSSDAAAGAPGLNDKKPTVCIVIGMAGSGKTTLMQVRRDAMQRTRNACWWCRSGAHSGEHALMRRLLSAPRSLPSSSSLAGSCSFSAF
jgi:hypothetical protein